MRVLYWCVAAALLAVAGAASLRRTSLVEVSPRSTRRFTSPDTVNVEDLDRIDSAQSAPESTRPRNYSRRRDESVTTRTRTRTSYQNDDAQDIVPKLSKRKLSRSETPTSSTNVTNYDERNLNSRTRYSRTRKKPIDNNEEGTKEKTLEEGSTRAPSRIRARQQGRLAPTPATVEVSSPLIDEKKIEVISKTLDEITQIALQEEAQLTVGSTERAPTRSRQRTKFVSRDSNTDEKQPDDTTTRRTRGRTNTKSRSTTPKSELTDTVSSESINEVTVIFKDPTTARSTNDLRSSRKLRYKTRLSETETNLTGQGIAPENEGTNSSQGSESSEKSTEYNRVTFRPKTLSRSRGSAKSSSTLDKQSKNKSSGEIGADDNYPESFKALLQAKNASQQAVTPSDEGLSVKASQKVFNTFAPTSSDTKLSSAKRYTRFRKSQNSAEVSKVFDSSEDKDKVNNTLPSSTIKPFRVTSSDNKNRTSYLTKFRKSSSMIPSSTETVKVEIKQKYKFSRPNKFNLSGPTAGSYERNSTNQDQKTKVAIKKPVYRSSYFSRLRTSTGKPEIKSIVENINETSASNINLTKDKDQIEGVAESEEIPQPLSLTSKFHSSYKDGRSISNEPSIENVFTSAPAIRNIHSRNSLANARTLKPEELKVEQHNLESGEVVSKKYSESYSKTTLPTTNVIPGFEKSKGRFSSKYRAPFDRPLYQPTVPSVISSTAWLKFYVTDTHDTDTQSEPSWHLVGEDNVVFAEDIPTATQLIQNIPSRTHTYSTMPDAGEENELGPGINIISFSKTQSTPSSADLRLSETVLMPSHLINVETSLHSPSATISIFDALAEILTSTPKSTPSSTIASPPENPSTPNQILNGVSTNQPITLTIHRGIENENLLATKDIDITTVTKPVQTTTRLEIDVTNGATPEPSTTPPASTVSMKQPTELPKTSPSPDLTSFLPVTPRKPFATIILYSTTEKPPTDVFTTSSSPTSYRPPTTESSSMVFNTVSDLILSNNNIISSQLTSMLSDNIMDILLNMDEDTRAKVSVNMNAILRSLSARALANAPSVTDIVDATPNTTPFSENDILATQLNDTTFITDYSIDSSTSQESTIAATEVAPEVTLSDAKPTTTPESITPMKSILENSSSSKISLVVNETDLTRIPSQNTDQPLPLSLLNTSLNSAPVPFISNIPLDDDVSGELINTEVSSSTTSQTITSNLPVSRITTPFSFLAPLTLRPIMENFKVQDPCLLTPAQFWGLSKKARVLKIIEDIIRQHNIELTTTTRVPPSSSKTMNLIKKISNERLFSNNDREITTVGSISTYSLSTQAADIVAESRFLSTNTMTTDRPLLMSEIMSTSDSTNAGISEDEKMFTTPTVSTINTDSNDSEVSSSTERSDMDMTSPFSEPTIPIEISSTDNPMLLQSATSSISEAILSIDTSSLGSDQTTTEGIQFVENVINSTAQQSTSLYSPNSTSVQTTTPALLPTTTIAMESTTEALSEDITTEARSIDSSNLEIETTTETPSMAPMVDSKDIDISTTLTIGRVAAPISVTVNNSPPKKDYVIFGILPNNTVVRKNPNDDPLESLTETSPYIVYGVLPNNTIIRKFPNGTRVPRVMQKIDVLPISPWSLRNPYSPIHNNPAIVKPFNLIQKSINIMTPSNNTSSNGKDITGNIVNNTQLTMISSQALSVYGAGALATPKATSGLKATGTSTFSHVLSLRTSTMLPSINEILLNSISSATKEEQVVIIPVMTMTSTTMKTRILTLDIDPETKMIRTEKPENGMGGAIFKYIPIDEVKVEQKNSNVLKLATTKMNTLSDISTYTMPGTMADSSIQNNLKNVDISSRSATESLTTEIPTTTITESTSVVTTTTEISTTISTTTPIPRTTATPTTVEAETVSTTFLPTMFPPRRVQFKTVSEPLSTTVTPTSVPSTTLRRRTQITTTDPSDEIQMSSTNRPVFTSRTRPPKMTTASFQTTTTKPTTIEFTSARIVLPNRFGISTTDFPSTSTFSIEDDIVFLQNLKSVVNSNTDDPETSLANRIIALAVERSLNDLNVNKDSPRTAKKINNFGISSNEIPVPTTTTTTTMKTTTTPLPRTTATPITTEKSTPSIEEDIRQFQEDTKLLQALLKATGQNPASLQIPKLMVPNSNIRSTPNKNSNTIDEDLKLLGNLLASPSPLNEPFDSLIPKPNTIAIHDSKADNSNSLNVKPIIRQRQTTTSRPTSFRNTNAVTPSIEDDLKNFQEDTKLLQTLLQLQGGKVTTTPKNKVAITGLTGDETLASLLAQSNKKVVAATKAPLALSTEYGKTNDALLAALLKEQGFGPTTANSLEEQIKLAALLNQVVVTPKPRRPQPPPPPPPQPPMVPAPARRPILDGLAWLWQQWQDTAPGPGPARGARRPTGPARPAPSAAAAASAPPRVRWFGSGPFVGNADDAPPPPPPPPTSNRIPLEPPGAGGADPGRGQLVSAAINVTRAFSQFLGAAIQGAAKTVQNVIKAGRQAATDVYASGSG